jgi:hypothetical protein
MTEAILNMETKYLSSLRLQARYFLPFVGAVLAVGCTFGPAGTIAGRVSFVQGGWVVES